MGMTMAHFVEFMKGAARFIGTVKGIHDAGKMAAGAVQAAAPYISAAASML